MADQSGGVVSVVCMYWDWYWPAALHKLLTIIRVLSGPSPSSQQPLIGNRSGSFPSSQHRQDHSDMKPTKPSAVRFISGIYHYQVIRFISVTPTPILRNTNNIEKSQQTKSTIEFYICLELGIHLEFCAAGDFPLNTFNFSGANLPLALPCCCQINTKKLQSLSLSLEEGKYPQSATR